MKNFIAGVDLGGTKISAAVASADGKILGLETIPTLAHLGVSKVTDRIALSVKTACKKAGVSLQQIKCIGIGAPGPVDQRTGFVKNPPNLKGWTKVNLKEIMSDEYNKFRRETLSLSEDIKKSFNK
jgi:glucokinase